METAARILEFWFGIGTDDAMVAQQQSKLWWGKAAETDRLIRERFGATREAALRGALADWEASAEGRLALILLIDQFSRNMFRDDARAFAHDALARNWALGGIAARLDRRLRPLQRVFFYLPLEHSEELADQERALSLFEDLVASAPEAQRATLADFADYARRHHDIIKRFGRFPHRNKVLGRRSTAEELEFLRQPGSSF